MSRVPVVGRFLLRRRSGQRVLRRMLGLFPVLRKGAGRMTEHVDSSEYSNGVPGLRHAVPRAGTEGPAEGPVAGLPGGIATSHPPQPPTLARTPAARLGFVHMGQGLGAHVQRVIRIDTVKALIPLICISSQPPVKIRPICLGPLRDVPQGYFPQGLRTDLSTDPVRTFLNPLSRRCCSQVATKR
jgi:hypothetical protein